MTQEFRERVVKAIKDKIQCWGACKGAGPASVCRCEASADAAIALVARENADEIERLRAALLLIRDMGPMTVDDQRWRIAKDALEGE